MFRAAAMTATISVALTVGASAAAGPCDTARRGTYLSNVCFLTEIFSIRSLVKVRLISTDRRGCTADVVIQTSDLRHRIHFRRAELDRSRFYHVTDDLVCWELNGKKIVTLPGKNDSHDVVSVCGDTSFTFQRVSRALKNLYRKYCKGIREEF